MFLRMSLTTALISVVGYALMWARVCNFTKNKKFQYINRILYSRP